MADHSIHYQAQQFLALRLASVNLTPWEATATRAAVDQAIGSMPLVADLPRWLLIPESQTKTRALGGSQPKLPSAQVERQVVGVEAAWMAACNFHLHDDEPAAGALPRAAKFDLIVTEAERAILQDPTWNGLVFQADVAEVEPLLYEGDDTRAGFVLTIRARLHHAWGDPTAPRGPARY